jgi:hypothetical protein
VLNLATEYTYSVPYKPVLQMYTGDVYSCIDTSIYTPVIYCIGYTCLYAIVRCVCAATSLASNLGIPAERVVVTGIRSGSVVVEFYFFHVSGDSFSPTDLETVLNETISNGTLSVSTHVCSHHWMHHWV